MYINLKNQMFGELIINNNNNNNNVFGETQSKRLQKLQNRAARIILNASNDVITRLLCVH